MVGPMGNKYGISPLDVLDLLGPMMVIGPMLLWLVLIGPLLLYPLARWKAHREQVVDPQLGLKVALHYFALIAFQLLLLALAICIYTLFSKSESKGELYRMGFALLFPAGGVLAAHVALLKRTNEEPFPGVRRLFLGYNLVVTGLFGFAALLFAFQVFFAKGPAGDAGRLAIASVLVYVGAWAARGVQFGRIVLGPPSASAGPPGGALPTSAPAPASPQQSGPVLPSLGAGSFPPIDQK
jgi:hypothetical protein